MSETWPPTDGPTDGVTGEPAPVSASPPAADDTNPPGEQSYGPVDPSTGRPYGTAIPLPPPGAQPVWPTHPGQLPSSEGDPTGQNPSASGAPTPPAGTWGPPPQQGWSGGPYGAPPPYGGWTPRDFNGPYQPTPPPKKKRGLAVATAAVAVAVAVVAGAGLGHVVWTNQSTPTASASPNLNTPGRSGSSGGELSPFGSGSTGSSSAGAGAPSDISSIAAKVSPGLVDINTNLSYQDEQAAGTGMVLTSDGEVLTNNHVIDGATSISVTDVGNGKTYSANVVGYDRTGDIAVIKLVGASGLQTVSTSSSSAAVGQAVVGVGNAGGTGGTPSSAGGSITALNQSITATDDGGGNAESLTGLIQTNAAIEPGDSGGSLVNTSGQVIGMDTAASDGSGYQVSASESFAIPIGTALSVAKQIEAGHASSTIHIGASGFLGVSVQSSGSSASGGFGGGGNGFGSGIGSGSGTSTTGAVVEGTLANSPAAQAGLVQGDVITALNGSTVASSTDLSNLMQKYHPGDTVTLRWTDQSGQTQSANLKLTTGPPA